MKKTFLACLIILITSTSCDELTQIANQYPDVANQTVAPSQSEIIAGLKDALTVGIKSAVSSTNKTDGFNGNNLIHIPAPPEAEKVMQYARDFGLGSIVDDFETSLNRAAEEASGKAVDIFVNSITQMTINDAVGIWKGADDAATQYLKRTTTAELEKAFSPITKKAIEHANVAQYWNDVSRIYNQIHFVTKINPDLEKYVNEKAIEGLFVLVAQEEKDIRENPEARVTAILRRVFGYTGS